MKLNLRFIFPLLIPLITLLLTLQFNEVRGPYYLNVNSDPAYLYLVNSLNIATGRAVAHVDNPGTTVQIIGGVTIKIASLFRGVKDIQEDVFLHPEFYLELINKALLVLNLAVLFLLGVIALHLTGNVWMSILVQGAPFVSWQVMKAFTKVSPEPLSVLFALLLSLLLLIVLHRNDLAVKTGKYTLLFALVCGAGLVTKLTFIPLCLIPLILIPSVKWKLVFLGLTVLVFNILFLPGFPYYRHLYEWALDLLIHSGHYGEGPQDFVNPQDFFVHLKRIAVLYHTFLALVIASVVASCCLIFSKRQNRTSLQIRVLAAVSFTLMIHVLMVAKHYHPHYLIPAFTLAPVIIYLLFQVFKDASIRRFLSFLLNPVISVMVVSSVLIVLILRHNAGELIGRSLSEWLHLVFKENVPYFIVAGIMILVFSSALFYLKSNRRQFAFVTIVLASLAYHLRHIDLPGFYERSQFAKQEGVEMINQVENQHPGYLKILGDKSSSPLYALKYGTFFNFQQPHHFEKLQEIYGEEPVYFWGIEFYPRRFFTWTGEIGLDSIFLQNKNVILQGDTNGLTSHNLQLIETINEVDLELIYKGSLESLYLIRKQDAKIPVR